MYLTRWDKRVTVGYIAIFLREMNINYLGKGNVSYNESFY